MLRINATYPWLERSGTAAVKSLSRCQVEETAPAKEAKASVTAGRKERIRKSLRSAYAFSANQERPTRLDGK
jgi:hypothetical protein